MSAKLRYLLLFVFLIFLLTFITLGFYYFSKSSNQENLTPLTQFINSIPNSKTNKKFIFTNNIFGYKLKENNTENLKTFSNNWGIFVPSAVISPGNSAPSTITQVQVNLQNNPVKAMDGISDTRSLYKNQDLQELISNSTSYIDKEKQVLHIEIFLSSEWLKNPNISNMTIKSTNNEDIINYILNYHLLSELYTSSIIEMSKIANSTTENRLKEFQISVFNPLDNYLNDQDLFPIKLEKGIF